MDKQMIADIIEQVEKKHGKGSIYLLGSKYESKGIPRVTTGIEDLDYAIGGGMPKGRLIEIYGPESSGKTSLAYHLFNAYPLTLFIDMEGTFDSAYARTFLHNKKMKVLIRRPNWGEQAFELMLSFAEAGAPFIVVDSVPTMIPRKQFESKNVEKQEGVAMIAQLMSRHLPKLNTICEKSGTTVLFINQVREKIGGLPWSDPYQTPGGRMLKHLCSVRIQIGRKQRLQHDKLGMYGQISKIRVVKSKVCSPFREAELPIVFGRGFVEHEELGAIRKQLLKDLRSGK